MTYRRFLTFSPNFFTDSSGSTVGQVPNFGRAPKKIVCAFWAQVPEISELLKLFAKNQEKISKNLGEARETVLKFAKNCKLRYLRFSVIVVVLGPQFHNLIPIQLQTGFNIISCTYNICPSNTWKKVQSKILIFWRVMCYGPIWALLAIRGEIRQASHGPVRPYHCSQIHETLYDINQGDEWDSLVPHLSGVNDYFTPNFWAWRSSEAVGRRGPRTSPKKLLTEHS